jgi:hypothetical protein
MSEMMGSALRGRPTKKVMPPIVIAAIVIAALITSLFVIGAIVQPVTTTGEPQAADATGEDPALEYGYTLAQFDQVTNGMTLAQVEAIAGVGELTVDQDIAGYTGQIYQYVNPDGSNMMMQYQNGLLIQKAQFGLQ